MNVNKVRIPNFRAKSTFFDLPARCRQARRRLGINDMCVEERQKTHAHEWECKKCGYILRLELGPLCCEGGICKKCGGTVIYNGIKRGILKSTLGLSLSKP